LPRFVVAVAVFFLQQTPVEYPAAEEALGLEYLQAAEWPQVGQGPLPRPVAVEAEVLPQALRASEKRQPLPGGSLKQRQGQSRNTIAAVADKLAAWLAFEFV
jgi:hypothetical protein